MVPGKDEGCPPRLSAWPQSIRLTQNTLPLPQQFCPSFKLVTGDCWAHGQLKKVTEQVENDHTKHMM